MNGWKVLALVVTSWLATACGGEPASSSGGADDGTAALTAATLGAQSPLPAAEYLRQPQYAGADRENGRRLADMCKVCHTLGQGGVHMIGPNLFGFFGRQAGSAQRYTYSAALQAAEFSWTPRALDAWLARPERFLPGNRMSFPGVSGASDRRDVIVYLLEATSPQGGD